MWRVLEADLSLQAIAQLRTQSEIKQEFIERARLLDSPPIGILNEIFEAI